MKSQNDLFHGDENTTDKPRKYLVTMSEVVQYEVEVEAMDEEEAQIKAHNELVDSYELENYSTRLTGFQTDSVKPISDSPQQNYNYSLNYGGTD